MFELLLHFFSRHFLNRSNYDAHILGPGNGGHCSDVKDANVPQTLINVLSRDNNGPSLGCLNTDVIKEEGIGSINSLSMGIGPLRRSINGL